ncbi:MAG: DUF3421 domain-containing protein [Bacteroidetes bacterium]|nr:DUF3421 domain-containing protein [Bacteroidota bacterium]
MKKTILTLILMLMLSIPSLAQNKKCIKWVEASDGYIPRHAVVGGDEDGDKLYIARAYYRGGTHPGKIKRGWDGCNIGYGGKEIMIRDYEVLVYNRRNDDYDDNVVKDIIRFFGGKDLSVETLRVRDTFDDDWKKGIFVKDEEKSSLNRKLGKLQKIALNEDCDDLADSIDNLRKYLRKSMPSRTEVKKKLDKLYEISKDCN